MDKDIDVLIIGGGPAGLSAAIELKRLGISRIVIIEREEQAGGIPRHCGHFPFGMREFGRILTGMQYAKKLVKTALKAGVEIFYSCSVVEVKQGGKLLITDNDGMREISASRVIYATGVREKPRSARLISGSRAQGIINTGALQAMVFLEAQKPFERPVIIGSELVAFSAIQTCKHAKIKPVAMIEKSKNVTAQWPVELFAPMSGLPIYRQTKLLKIIGEKQVSAVEIEDQKGKKRLIECDGVILSGDFTPEASLARSGHLEIDAATNGPKVDQYGRCSDPSYFAAGNILRPVETSGWSWNEGRKIGAIVAADLKENIKKNVGEIKIITSGDLITYAMPQKISLPNNSELGMESVQLRFNRRAKGNLIALADGKQVYSKKLKTYPQKRVLIPINRLVGDSKAGEIELKFEQI